MIVKVFKTIYKSNTGAKKKKNKASSWMQKSKPKIQDCRRKVTAPLIYVTGAAISLINYFCYF